MKRAKVKKPAEIDKRVFLTMEETASILRLCEDIVRAIIRRGELRAVRMGRKLMVSAESIWEFVFGDDFRRHMLVD